MTAAHQVYIFNQLEPDSVLIVGNAKRYKPVDSVKEFIEKFGEEKYYEMVEQERADAERKKENLNR